MKRNSLMPEDNYFTNANNKENAFNSGPLISVILPTYNRLYSLKTNILPSLNSQNFKNYELIIVDDGSSDGTSEYFCSHSFIKDYPYLSSATSLITNKQNQGLPTSRNIAVSKMTGKWVFMVEDDIKLDGDDFLDKACAFIFEHGEAYKIISPRIVTKTRNHYDGLFSGFCKTGHLSKEIYMNLNYRKREYNASSTHACSFINNSVFKLSKYPDLKGIAFREESNFYIKATKKGIKILYTGDDLKIYHNNEKAKTGGTRILHHPIKIQFYYIYCHYLYLKNNFNFPKIRLIFFVIVWFLKQFSYYCKLHVLKRFLVYISI
jgi:glycosyltransferase involved in cell wall biosynthesis